MEPLLSIAIPTFNRAPFLKANLEYLKLYVEKFESNSIEIIVSDNCSQDETPKVVESLTKQGFDINYIRNNVNIGWGRNFLQCFKLSRGKYIIILGDDDFICDGAIERIFNVVKKRECGTIFMRPYGFNNDHRNEYPGKIGGFDKYYKDKHSYFTDISSLMRMISACVINKNILKSIEVEKVQDGNFTHLHLIIRAILAAMISKFLIK